MDFVGIVKHGKDTAEELNEGHLVVDDDHKIPFGHTVDESPVVAAFSTAPSNCLQGSVVAVLGRMLTSR